MFKFSPQFLKIQEELNKKYPGAFRQSTGQSFNKKIPSGWFNVDRALRGGIPAKRLTLVYGPKDAMKTTFALRTLADWQKRCPLCLIYQDLCQCPPPAEDEIRPTQAVFIDQEIALDEGHVVRLGVDHTRLHIFRPEYGELACEYAEEFAKAPDVGFIIFDSIAAIASKAEASKGYLDAQAWGDRAKLVNRMYRALIKAVGIPDVPRTVIAINHQQSNPNGRGGVILPGGTDQRYLSSVVIKLQMADRQNKITYNQEGEEMTLAYSESGYAKPKPKEDPRTQDISFLIEHSKVSPENIAGEVEVYLEDGDGFRFGDSDDTRTVFLSGQKKGFLYKENGTSGKWCNTFTTNKFQTQNALFKHWLDNQLEYKQFQEKLIGGEK